MHQALFAAADAGQVPRVRELLQAAQKGGGEDAKEAAGALRRAVYERRPTAVSAFLKAGADASAADDLRQTSLHWAARLTSEKESVLAMAEDLLCGGVSADAKSKNGSTALHIAAENDDAALIRLLLRHRANPAISGALGRTPMHLAAEQGKAKAAEALLEACSSCCPAVGSTCPAPAAAEDDCAATAVLEAANNKGDAPLASAAAKGHVAIVELMLGAGADVNRQNRWGQSALLLAARSDCAPVVGLLLQAGADANRAARDGSLPLHAAAEKNGEVVELLVEFGGARVNAQHVGLGSRTALHVAAEKGSLACLEVLLALKANPMAYTDEGRTPLSFAAARGELEAARALVAKGADVNADDDKGRSAMHEAAGGRHFDIIRYLLRQGAKLPTEFYGDEELVVLVEELQAEKAAEEAAARERQAKELRKMQEAAAAAMAAQREASRKMFEEKAAAIKAVEEATAKGKKAAEAERVKQEREAKARAFKADRQRAALEKEVANDLAEEKKEAAEAKAAAEEAAAAAAAAATALEPEATNQGDDCEPPADAADAAHGRQPAEDDAIPCFTPREAVLVEDFYQRMLETLPKEAKDVAKESGSAQQAEKMVDSTSDGVQDSSPAEEDAAESECGTPVQVSANLQAATSKLKGLLGGLRKAAPQPPPVAEDAALDDPDKRDGATGKTSCGAGATDSQGPPAEDLVSESMQPPQPEQPCRDDAAPPSPREEGASVASSLGEAAAANPAADAVTAANEEQQLPAGHEEDCAQQAQSLPSKLVEFEAEHASPERGWKSATLTPEEAMKAAFLSWMESQGDGRLAVAWRRHFDPKDLDSMSFLDFCKVLDKMSYKEDALALWQALHPGGSQSTRLNLAYFDPEAAAAIPALGRWCKETVGCPSELFARLDVDNKGSITSAEFLEGLRKFGLYEAAKEGHMPLSLQSQAAFQQALLPVIDPWKTGLVLALDTAILEADLKARRRLRRKLEKERDNGGREVLPAFGDGRSAMQLLAGLAKKGTALGGGSWHDVEEQTFFSSEAAKAFLEESASKAPPQGRQEPRRSAVRSLQRARAERAERSKSVPALAKASPRSSDGGSERLGRASSVAASSLPSIVRNTSAPHVGEKTKANMRCVYKRKLSEKLPAVAAPVRPAVPKLPSKERAQQRQVDGIGCPRQADFLRPGAANSLAMQYGP
eukprot:TRINITY_DN34306_c0_g1_i2.p1 TRINITY_DN34306_c0_g1~~TRINITY_DN34306_c0_g1_i2.p1  ORF type:complete len:1184 (-),score=390.21 TRINITY_DN34306_c0_g1_i2:270-3821(-)